MHQHDIIIIAAEPWEHRTWRRRHHLAWNLAKNNRVLFLEPPLTIFNPFRDIGLSWRHLLNLGRLKYQGRNLYSYSPVRLLPLSFPGAERFNYFKKDQRRIFNKLKKIIKKLQFKDPILWVYFSQYHYDYYGLFDEKVVVTDWFDKFSAPTFRGNSSSWLSEVQKRESNIIANADIVFTASKELHADLNKVHDNVYTILHGVAYESFSKSENRTFKIGMLDEIKTPIIGFLGLLHYVVDIDLLAFIAESRPDWSIVLMGREWITQDSDRLIWQRLKKKFNVKYFGEVSRDQIPAYLKYIDVGIIPLKKIEFTSYASAPLKLLEYLAAGKPVVAVDQGFEYEFSEYVEVAKTKEEYVNAIDKILEIERSNGYFLAEKRKEIARQNSWMTRVNQMMEIIESHLNDLNLIYK